MENIKPMKKILLKIYKKLFFNKEQSLDAINISVIKVY